MNGCNQKPTAVITKINDKTFCTLIKEIFERGTQFRSGIGPKGEDSDIADIAFKQFTFYTGNSDMSARDIELERLRFTFSANCKLYRCTRFPQHFSDNKIAIDAGHIFAVNRDNQVARFQSNLLSGRSGHWTDNGKVIASRINPCADSIIGAFHTTGSLGIDMRIHIRGMFITKRIEHPANGTLHQFQIIDGLIYVVVMDDLPGLPEGGKEGCEFVGGRFGGFGHGRRRSC